MIAVVAIKRMAEFLGKEMIKGSGISCHFIISKQPYGAKVTDRAIPIQIFNTEPEIKRRFLKKWLNINGKFECNMKDIIDWDYYIERLSFTIQKMLSIPAAL